MASDWPSDLVVGVDFGMTYTGVAYSYGTNWSAPKQIQHWPGLVGSQIATKVPSHILSTTHDSKDIKQFFKLNLDPDFIDKRPDAPTREQAMRYFTDYIGCVYRYVIDYFGRTLRRFKRMKVEFVFSVPTTWKDPRMVEELRGAVRFGDPKHRAVIGLTEAEAAAVYVSELYYQKNDVILVCDAGGGTTDVNVLKLASAPGEPTVYNSLGFVERKPIGSFFIDLAVHQLICAKLEPLQMALPVAIEDIAWQMMTGRFERFKCSFGVQGVEQKTLQLDLPPAVTESYFPESGIYEGQLWISSDEIRAICDAKIEDLFELLDEQIRRLQLSHPSERIFFLVLSGGFGSCPYIRTCLTARYETPPHLVPEGIKVLTVDEPQLAVVQGQVMNRTQQLKSHAPVFNHLYSSVSYGVIVDWVYDPKKHIGELTRYDERNGKTYAVNQIEWIVRKGDLIPRIGLSQSFPEKISPRNLSNPFVAQIVMSQSPPETLPRSMRSPDAKLICEIEVDTAAFEKKPKNHRWYNRGPVYFMVTVIVRLVVEQANLEFLVTTKDGTRVGGRSAGGTSKASPNASISTLGMSPDPGGGFSSKPELPGIAKDPVKFRWERTYRKECRMMGRHTVVPEIGGDATERIELPGDTAQVQYSTS
ncbi:Hsp70 family protein [Aspergillus stella-maris]|uniref:Hsp70 family protein n=1 Tax=Aspergillus stella-maris TaxID=1810926 RepID=UPI003CCE0551